MIPVHQQAGGKFQSGNGCCAAGDFCGGGYFAPTDLPQQRKTSAAQKKHTAVTSAAIDKFQCHIGCAANVKKDTMLPSFHKNPSGKSIPKKT